MKALYKHCTVQMQDTAKFSCLEILSTFTQALIH